MIPVTIWQRLNSKNIYEHNHYEEGHSTADEPHAEGEDQAKLWQGAKWRKQFGFRDSNYKIQPMRA